MGAVKKSPASSISNWRTSKERELPFPLYPQSETRKQIMNADYPSMKTQPKLTAADYHGYAIQLIEKDGQRWLTARDLGICLGYSEANARQGIINLYNRHLDEFTEKDSCEIKLISQGQVRLTGRRRRGSQYLQPRCKWHIVRSEDSKPQSKRLPHPSVVVFLCPYGRPCYVGRAKNTTPARGIIPAALLRLLSLPTPIATRHGTTSKIKVRSQS